jgi:hypothetical protein
VIWPFDQRVEIRTNPEGASLLQTIGHVEPSEGSSETARGERYDASGQLAIDSAEHLVGQANRQVVCEGVTYKVVSAVAYSVLPHVAVQLLELRPGG